jgi:Family of unknown function (DUF6159)
MDISKLVEYITQQLSSGVSAQDITTQLRTANWSEDVIKSAFNAAQQQVTPTPAVQTDPSKIQLPPPIARSRIKTGWMLFKQSMSIIGQNRTLYRYILMTIMFTVIISAVYLTIFMFDFNGPMILSAEYIDSDGGLSYISTWQGLLFAFTVVYISTFITYFYATALSSHTLGIFRGSPGLYKDHIKIARSKISAIALYALIATAVGYILRIIEQRFKVVGWLIAKILGAIWALATSFVLPIIADSDKHGVGPIKESVLLFKQTWGETITSRVTLSGLIYLIYFLIALPMMFVLLLILGNLFGIAGVIIAIALFVLGVFCIAILDMLATSVLNTCLYYYAKYNAIPPSFSPELMASVFKAAKSKK